MTTTNTHSAYTWDNGMIEGRRRLALLEHALDPATVRRFDTIGVGDGWRCLELGAGGGSMTSELARRVGPTGNVTAVDLDTRFVRALELPNVETREQNIFDCDLPAGSFDLAHSRWTLLHIPGREAVIEKLVSLLKPGGVLFLEEADVLPNGALDTGGFGALTKKIVPIIAERGSHCAWARDLPRIAEEAGIAIDGAESEFTWFSGRSELAEFWKISWTRVRDGVASSGADVSAWDRELAELDDPTKRFVSPMTVAVWGKKK